MRADILFALFTAMSPSVSSSSAWHIVGTSKYLIKECVNELACFSVTGMGKGQHRMPSKDELVQRYNRMNTIPQVLLVALVPLSQDKSPWISLGYRDGWGNIGSDEGGWLIDHFKQSGTF